MMMWVQVRSAHGDAGSAGAPGAAEAAAAVPAEPAAQAAARRLRALLRVAQRQLRRGRRQTACPLRRRDPGHTRSVRGRWRSQESPHQPAHPLVQEGLIGWIVHGAMCDVTPCPLCARDVCLGSVRGAPYRQRVELRGNTSGRRDLQGRMKKRLVKFKELLNEMCNRGPWGWLRWSPWRHTAYLYCTRRLPPSPPTCPFSPHRTISACAATRWMRPCRD